MGDTLKAELEGERRLRGEGIWPGWMEKPGYQLVRCTKCREINRGWEQEFQATEGKYNGDGEEAAGYTDGEPGGQLGW